MSKGYKLNHRTGTPLLEVGSLSLEGLVVATERVYLASSRVPVFRLLEVRLKLVSDSLGRQFSCLQSEWERQQGPRGKTGRLLHFCYCWSPSRAPIQSAQHPGRKSSSLSLVCLFNFETTCLLSHMNGRTYFKGSSYTDQR